MALWWAPALRRRTVSDVTQIAIKILTRTLVRRSAKMPKELLHSIDFFLKPQDVHQRIANNCKC